jgi:alanyl-tRNA synthetase
MKYIVSRREESDRRAIAALISYIPLLCNALLQFNMFHSTQQVKAQEELEEQRHVLETHIELFGDSAPIKKEDIERRIREFVNIINKSTQLSLQLADSQKRTWIERKNVLTPQISQILVEEYRAILEHMRGPMREVLRAFVDELTGKHNQDVIEPIVSLKSEATSASAVTTTSDVMSSPTIHEEITRFVEQRGYFKKSDELPDLSDTNLKEEPQSNNSFSESDLVKSSKHEFPVSIYIFSFFANKTMSSFV